LPTGTSLSHLRTTPLKELLRGKLNRLSPIQAALSRFKRAPPGKAQSALSDSIGSLPLPPGTVLVRQPAPSLPKPRQPAPFPRQPAPLANRRPSPYSRARHFPPTRDDLSSTGTSSPPALHHVNSSSRSARPQHRGQFFINLQSRLLTTATSRRRCSLLRFSCVANGVCLWCRRPLRFARHKTASLIASLLLRCIPHVPVAPSVPSLRLSQDGVARCFASLALQTACACGAVGPFAALVTRRRRS
jgi:hypothetical protein